MPSFHLTRDNGHVQQGGKNPREDELDDIFAMADVTHDGIINGFELEHIVNVWSAAPTLPCVIPAAAPPPPLFLPSSQVPTSIIFIAILH